MPDLPCRAGQVVERCLNGLAPDDPFEVRVGWDWAELPGIVHEGRDYRARSMANCYKPGRHRRNVSRKKKSR